MNILVYSFLVFNFLSDATSLYCYWNTGCPYKFLSRKTPYVAVRSDIRDSIVKLTGCEPVSLWGLARHGKKYPSSETAKNMKEAMVIRDYIVSSYEKGSSSLCAQDVDNLRTWKPDDNVFEKVEKLSEEGYQESRGIGSRLKQAFPKLLENLDTKNYTIRPALKNSIEESAEAFVNGLQNERLVIDKVNEDYDIMAPYINCKKYEEEVLNNPKTYLEMNKYFESSEYLAMKDRLKRRLGINYSLSDMNITALYDWCRYSWSGIDNKISPWCAIFTTEDLKALEYAEDLKAYYKNGYGTQMTQKFGKIPMADLLKQFQEVKEGNGKDMAVYFTKGSTIEMVFTALNLFRDNKPLTGVRKINDRKWRNSKISPYLANLLAVLNRCGTSDYNVVFYLNEEPLIPICKDGVCAWQEFENKLKPFADANTDFC